jgi:hypothetical protein
MCVELERRAVVSGRRTCVRTRDGVRCVGEPNPINKLPVDDEGWLEFPGGRDAIAIDLGSWLTQCVLAPDGAIWCREDRPTGVVDEFSRSGLGAAQKLELDSEVGCALLKNGSAHCWFDELAFRFAGLNPDLNRPPEASCGPHARPDCTRAINSFENSTSPTPISGAALDVTVASGLACVLESSGVVRCLDLHRSSLPFHPGIIRGPAQDFGAIEGLPPLVAIDAANDHVCGHTSDGEVWCWGSNTHGQLGDGTTTTSRETPRPVRAGQFEQLSALVVDEQRSCVIARGRIECWGEPFVTRPTAPNRIPDLRAKSLQARVDSTCAELDDGWVCWGADARDRFAGAQQQARPQPLEQRDGWPLRMQDMATDCYASSQGRLRCFHRETGELVLERADVLDLDVNFLGLCATFVDRAECLGDYHSPRTIAEPQIRAICGSPIHGCFVDRHGTAHCWKDGDSPVAIAGTHELVDVVATTIPYAKGACGLDVDKRVHCWGDWRTDERGIGKDPDPVPTDARVLELPPIEQIVGMAGHVCARDEDGGVWCWGNNEHGQLGDAFHLRSSREPVRVPGIEATQIVSGRDHLCALEARGGVTCWGSDSDGRRGRVDPGLMLSPQPLELVPAFASSY